MAKLLDVIEWRPDDPNALVGRVPESGPADIKFGAQLIVYESQSAVFFRDGKAMDTFGPGRHTLSTANVPLLSEWLQKFTGGKNVFSAEVYYVNQRIMTDLKWGTPNPIDLKDPDLGWVQLRAFGTMSVRIDDPGLFINTLVGTQGAYDNATLNKFLKGSVRTRLNDLLSTSFQSYASIRSNLDELAAAMKVKVKDDFGKYGISLRDFFIQDVSVPEEIQEAFRLRAKMGALGVQNYMQLKAADAMGDMAKNEGTGGSTMQMGAGMGMGMMMPQMMQAAFAGSMQPQPPQQPQQPVPVAAASMVACSSCKAQVPANTKFCPECGGKIVLPPPAGMIACPGCNAQISDKVKFCPECGAKTAPEPVKCPNCGTQMESGVKFCGECGHKLA